MNFSTFIDSINWIQIVLSISIAILSYLRFLRVGISLNKKKAHINYYKEYKQCENHSQFENRSGISDSEKFYPRNSNNSSILLSVLILIIYAFLNYTTISQYIELKKNNNNSDVDVGEILLIVGSITGGLIILIVGIVVALFLIAVVFFLIAKITMKFEPFEFPSKSHKTKLNNPDFDFIKKTALDFVSNDQPKEAIRYLLDRETKLENYILDSIRLNSSKLVELNRNKHLDLISSQEYNLQKSKIINSLIQTIKEIE